MIELPDTVSYEQAAMLEPMAASIRIRIIALVVDPFVVSGKQQGSICAFR